MTDGLSGLSSFYLHLYFSPSLLRPETELMSIFFVSLICHVEDQFVISNKLYPFHRQPRIAICTWHYWSLRVHVFCTPIRSTTQTHSHISSPSNELLVGAFHIVLVEAVNMNASATGAFFEWIFDLDACAWETFP